MVLRYLRGFSLARNMITIEIFMVRDDSFPSLLLQTILSRIPDVFLCFPWRFLRLMSSPTEFYFHLTEPLGKPPSRRAQCFFGSLPKERTLLFRTDRS